MQFVVQQWNQPYCGHTVLTDINSNRSAAPADLVGNNGFSFLFEDFYKINNRYCKIHGLWSVFGFGHYIHLTFTNIISHACKYFNSEVAASRSEVMPIGIVKLLLRNSEVKYSAYRAEGTLHARSALHLWSILHVPLAGHLVQKSTFVGRQKCFFVAKE